MTDWKPIETAPRDGSEVLLFEPGMDAAYWMAMETEGFTFPANSGRVVGRFYDNNWVSHAAEAGWDGSVEPAPLRPTHWMPLPSPPDAR